MPLIPPSDLPGPSHSAAALTPPIPTPGQARPRRTPASPASLIHTAAREVASCR